MGEEDAEERDLRDNKKFLLIENVRELFDSETNSKDLAILYEITGYQGDNPVGDDEFWANYANYKVLGADQIDLNSLSLDLTWLSKSDCFSY